MADWQGLFNWSTQYHDGTTASKPDVQPMSDEDRKWLTEAMHQYTFNDADRLKEICEEMKKDVQSEFRECENSSDLLEELQELIEIHERNSTNLTMMGGLDTLLQYMCRHPDNSSRRIACQTFSQVVQNNFDVQKVAHVLGTLNLMNILATEQDEKNREALLGALSSFLRGLNFPGKREFIEKKNGLQFLTLLLQDKQITTRMQKKILFLLCDLVSNDENTFADKKGFTRSTLIEQPGILNKMFEILMVSGQNLNEGQSWDIRENTLMILAALFEVQPNLRAQYNQILTAHKLKLAKEVQVCDPDLRDLYLKELLNIEQVEGKKQAPEEEKKQPLMIGI